MSLAVFFICSYMASSSVAMIYNRNGFASKMTDLPVFLVFSPPSVQLSPWTSVSWIASCHLCPWQSSSSVPLWLHHRWQESWHHLQLAFPLWIYRVCQKIRLILEFLYKGCNMWIRYWIFDFCLIIKRLRIQFEITIKVLYFARRPIRENKSLRKIVNPNTLINKKCWFAKPLCKWRTLAIRENKFPQNWVLLQYMDWCNPNPLTQGFLTWGSAPLPPPPR